MKTSENILTLRLAGIDPPSSRRRIKYLFRFWFPFLCYAALCVGWTFPIKFPEQAFIFHLSQFHLTATKAFVVASIGLVLLRIVVENDRLQLRNNWQHYRSAGILGRDILWASSQPEFRSGIWLATLALAINVILAILVVSDWSVQLEYFILVLATVDAGFLLTGGVLLNAATWTRSNGLGAQLFTAGILLLCSPALLWFGCALALRFFPNLVIYYMWINNAIRLPILPLAIIMLAFRIWWVRRFWKRAIQELDGQLD